MDVDKSIKNGELSRSDGTYMRIFAYRTILITGFVIYSFFQLPSKGIGFREIIAMILVLALMVWAGRNAFQNYFNGNKLLNIQTKLSIIQNCKIARKTIERLHWKIRIEEENYFIATYNYDDYDWNDYEITIICLEGKILFNYRGMRKGRPRKALFGPVENEKYRLIFAEEFQRQKTTNNEK